MAHNYEDIINHIVWDIIHDDIPEIKEYLENILEIMPDAYDFLTICFFKYVMFFVAYTGIDNLILSVEIVNMRIIPMFYMKCSYSLII